jgi:Subtilase family
MPEKPALSLGPPIPGERTTKPGRGSLYGPGEARQASRLEPKFERLTAAFEAERLTVADDPGALEPERVLVLEIAGELSDFVRAVQKVEGLEFLAEQLEDKAEPEDDFVVTDRDGKRKPYNRTLFLVASDQQAWRETLSLWARFKKGEKMKRGFTPFRDLFARLRDLRPWDDRDRLEETGVLDVWERELEGVDGDELIAFEAELWMREDEQRRKAAVAQLRADLEQAGGELLQTVVLREIGYHGVLGRVPASRLRETLADHRVRWMKTEGVRFFHAVGQIAAIAPLEADPESAPPAPDTAPSGPPEIALLDGVPLANHQLLGDHVQLDDPGGFEAVTPVDRRVHGTCMASLVIHGDLNDDPSPLRSPIYVRPILTTHAPDWVREPPEELPRDRLPVDLIHEAVARLFEGDQPAAPTIKAIILAVGDRAQQFSRFISPLARLLDWLASRYGVLFIVAAGNHLGDLEIPADTGLEDPQELQHELLCALQKSASYRRLLSPAESINALTVGASHNDKAAAIPQDDRVDGIVTPDLASPISAIGSGVAQAVKPDILVSGGRQLLRLEPADGETRLITMQPTSRPPGAKAAAPGTAGDLAATAHMTGTSVAAAVAGHRAGRILERLAELRSEDERFPAEQFDPVLLKAALAHGAAWGSASTFVMNILEELNLGRNRDSIARFIGYGQCPARETLICDDHRVTVLAASSIEKDAAHTYRFPLPASLSSQAAHRRVTLTLAWISPINPSHRAYRRSALKLEPAGVGDLDNLLGDRIGATMHGTRRGTLQHEVREGDQAVPFAPGTELQLVISCRASAGALDQSTPYAAMVTIEVPESLGLPIYQDVRQALKPQIPAPRPRG